MHYSRGIALEHMLRAEKTSAEISAFEFIHEEEIRFLKERSIESLRALHPEFFQRMVDFENWKEANDYLEKYQEVVLKFWEK